MRFERLAFGSIEVDGMNYEHNLIDLAVSP